MTEPTGQAERPTEGSSELDQLVGEYRSRCLWFLRPDFYPRTDAEIRRVLHEIEAHGDVPAFQRAANIRRSLSPDSSESSAAS
jgi:hypothetical protein